VGLSRDKFPVVLRVFQPKVGMRGSLGGMRGSLGGMPGSLVGCQGPQ